MIIYLERRRFSLPVRILSFFICFSFILTSLFPTPAVAQTIGANFFNLPLPGQMLVPSSGYVPPMIKGVVVHPENPLQFDFIVNTGDEELSQDAVRLESDKLIKYFLSALTVPEKEIWVNLSPYEGGKMIPSSFGQTEMGRDLLAQDYLLKQLTASLMYPEDDLGQKFWDRVYKKAYDQFGTTDIPMNTFNKVWIMPEDAVVYQNGNTAYVLESRLKVMLEEDYLALQKQKKEMSTETSPLVSDMVREVLIPEIEKEINEGKTFANLRQMYNSMILATWFKLNLKESLLGQVYVNQNKTKGIDQQDRQANQKIYNQYLKAFRVGVYDYIKEDYDPYKDELIPRKYFSGGYGSNAVLPKMVGRNQITGAPRDLSSEQRKFVQARLDPKTGKDFINTVNLLEIGTQANNNELAKARQGLPQVADPPALPDRQAGGRQDLSTESGHFTKMARRRLRALNDDIPRLTKALESMPQANRTQSGEFARRAHLIKERNALETELKNIAPGRTDLSSESEDEYYLPIEQSRAIIEAYEKRGKGDEHAEFVDHTRSGAYLEIDFTRVTVRKITFKEYLAHHNHYDDGHRTKQPRNGIGVAVPEDQARAIIGAYKRRNKGSQTYEFVDQTRHGTYLRVDPVKGMVWRLTAEEFGQSLFIRFEDGEYDRNPMDYSSESTSQIVQFPKTSEDIADPDAFGLSLMDLLDSTDQRIHIKVPAPDNTDVLESFWGYGLREDPQLLHQAREQIIQLYKTHKIEHISDYVRQYELTLTFKEEVELLGQKVRSVRLYRSGGEYLNKAIRGVKLRAALFEKWDNQSKRGTPEAKIHAHEDALRTVLDRFVPLGLIPLTVNNDHDRQNLVSGLTDDFDDRASYAEKIYLEEEYAKILSGFKAEHIRRPAAKSKFGNYIKRTGRYNFVVHPELGDIIVEYVQHKVPEEGGVSKEEIKDYETFEEIVRKTGEENPDGPIAEIYHDIFGDPALAQATRQEFDEFLDVIISSANQEGPVSFSSEEDIFKSAEDIFDYISYLAWVETITKTPKGKQRMLDLVFDMLTAEVDFVKDDPRVLALQEILGKDKDNTQRWQRLIFPHGLKVSMQEIVAVTLQALQIEPGPFTVRGTLEVAKKDEFPQHEEIAVALRGREDESFFKVALEFLLKDLKPKAVKNFGPVRKRFEEIFKDRIAGIEDYNSQMSLLLAESQVIADQWSGAPVSPQVTLSDNGFTIDAEKEYKNIGKDEAVSFLLSRPVVSEDHINGLRERGELFYEIPTGAENQFGVLDYPSVDAFSVKNGIGIQFGRWYYRFAADHIKILDENNREVARSTDHELRLFLNSEIQQTLLNGFVLTVKDSELVKSPAYMDTFPRFMKSLADAQVVSIASYEFTPNKIVVTGDGIQFEIDRNNGKVGGMAMVSNRRALSTRIHLKTRFAWAMAQNYLNGTHAPVTQMPPLETVLLQDPPKGTKSAETDLPAGRQDLSSESLVSAISDGYRVLEKALKADPKALEVQDQHMGPIAVRGADGNPIGLVQKGDSVISFNFRRDRTDQLTTVWMKGSEFEHFDAEDLDLTVVTMMEDENGLVPVDNVVFPPIDIPNTIGEYLANRGKRQFRIAETEKYRHVTRFFNGGARVEEFPGEKRLLIPSPKVGTYDLKPEMSAYDVTDELIQQIRKGHHDLYVANYANPDMVGHTGNFEAVVQAIHHVDQNLRDLLHEARSYGLNIIITADHGNADEMIDHKKGEKPQTKHSKNPVPFIFIPGDMAERYAEPSLNEFEDAGLADVAPTLLRTLGLNPPKEMTGRNLIEGYTFSGKQQSLLIVLDGFGYNPDRNDPGDAIRIASERGLTPAIDRLMKEELNMLISASGPAVGLPEGQMGNSEVGHAIMGSGRIIDSQPLVRVNDAVEDGSFKTNPALLKAIHNARDNGKALHLNGLVSDGGIHSDMEHIYALLELAKQEGLQDVYVHAELDGRDTPPQSAEIYIQQLQEKIDEIGVGQIATMIGRFYAMDRDTNWNRTKVAYDLYVRGQAEVYVGGQTDLSAEYSHKPRILLVDDNPDMQLYGRKSLETVGYEVVVATTGAEAWDIIQTNPKGFHGVVAKEILPRSGGLELIQKIHDMEEEEKRPGVIISSENLDELQKTMEAIHAVKKFKKVSLTEQIESVDELVSLVQSEIGYPVEIIHIEFDTDLSSETITIDTTGDEAIKEITVDQPMIIQRKGGKAWERLELTFTGPKEDRHYFLRSDHLAEERSGRFERLRGDMVRQLHRGGRTNFTFYEGDENIVINDIWQGGDRVEFRYLSDGTIEIDNSHATKKLTLTVTEKTAKKAKKVKDDEAADLSSESTGIIGRWKFDKIRFSEKKDKVGKLEIVKAQRLPHKRRGVEPEFLIDGKNRVRNIFLKTRALNAKERKILDRLSDKLGSLNIYQTGSVRVINRDEVAAFNRVYGVAHEDKSFIREDVFTQGNDDQILEVLHHLYLTLKAEDVTREERHDFVRSNRFNGNFGALAAKLSDRDKLLINRNKERAYANEKLDMAEQRYQPIVDALSRFFGQPKSVVPTVVGNSEDQPLSPIFHPDREGKRKLHRLKRHNNIIVSRTDLETNGAFVGVQTDVGPTSVYLSVVVPKENIDKEDLLERLEDELKEKGFDIRSQYFASQFIIGEPKVIINKETVAVTNMPEVGSLIDIVLWFDAGNVLPESPLTTKEQLPVVQGSLMQASKFARRPSLERKIRVGLNGPGRTGITILRNFLLHHDPDQVELVATQRYGAEDLKRKLLLDSIHGYFPYPIETGKDKKGEYIQVTVDGKTKRVYAFRHDGPMEEYNWDKYGVDIVLDATGRNLSREALEGHLKAGAKRVILTQPSKAKEGEHKADFGMVIGVNDQLLLEDAEIIDCASCTTNNYVPAMYILSREWKGQEVEVLGGNMETIHAYTSTQSISDRVPRRGKDVAAALNMLLESTGAASATTPILPSLKGKLSANSLRVNSATGSITVERNVVRVNNGTELTADIINEKFRDFANSKQLKGVFAVEEGLVSANQVVGRSESSILFEEGTRVQKIGENEYVVSTMTWYDNEWGYSTRITDAVYIVGQKLIEAENKTAGKTDLSAEKNAELSTFNLGLEIGQAMQLWGIGEENIYEYAEDDPEVGWISKRRFLQMLRKNRIIEDQIPLAEYVVAGEDKIKIGINEDALWKQALLINIARMASWQTETDTVKDLVKKQPGMYYTFFRNFEEAFKTTLKAQLYSLIFASKVKSMLSEYSGKTLSPEQIDLISFWVRDPIDIREVDNKKFQKGSEIVRKLREKDEADLPFPRDILEEIHNGMLAALDARGLDQFAPQIETVVFSSYGMEKTVDEIVAEGVAKLRALYLETKDLSSESDEPTSADDLLLKPISEIKYLRPQSQFSDKTLWNRIIKVLSQANIKTVGDLVKMTISELKAVEDLGDISLALLLEALRQKGLQLKPEPTTDLSAERDEKSKDPNIIAEGVYQRLIANITEIERNRGEFNSDWIIERNGEDLYRSIVKDLRDGSLWLHMQMRKFERFQRVFDANMRIVPNDDGTFDFTDLTLELDGGFVRASELIDQGVLTQEHIDHIYAQAQLRISGQRAELRRIVEEKGYFQPIYFMGLWTDSEGVRSIQQIIYKSKFRFLENDGTIARNVFGKEDTTDDILKFQVTSKEQAVVIRENILELVDLSSESSDNYDRFIDRAHDLIRETSEYREAKTDVLNILRVYSTEVNEKRIKAEVHSFVEKFRHAGSQEVFHISLALLDVVTEQNQEELTSSQRNSMMALLLAAYDPDGDETLISNIELLFIVSAKSEEKYRSESVQRVADYSRIVLELDLTKQSEALIRRLAEIRQEDMEEQDEIDREEKSSDLSSESEYPYTLSDEEAGRMIKIYRGLQRGDPNREFVDQDARGAHFKINMTTSAVQLISEADYARHPNKFQQGSRVRGALDLSSEREFTKGGIDLNPELLDLQIKRGPDGVPLPLPQQPIHQMKIDGFLPVIINVTPIPSVPLLLGFADTSGSDRQLSTIPPQPAEPKNRLQSELQAIEIERLS